MLWQCNLQTQPHLNDSEEHSEKSSSAIPDNSENKENSSQKPLETKNVTIDARSSNMYKYFEE